MIFSRRSDMNRSAARASATTEQRPSGYITRPPFLIRVNIVSFWSSSVSSTGAAMALTQANRPAAMTATNNHRRIDSLGIFM